jgi:AraC-like DNA-binding protein
VKHGIGVTISCAKHGVVPSTRPTPWEVQRVICDRIREGASLRIEEIAASLFISRSTLQRAMADQGATFTAVRQRAQVEVAIEHLTTGSSCTYTAAQVGLSSDHLCKLVTDYVGLTPRQITRAWQLADRVRRWRRSVPPRANTKLYFRRLERWKKIDAELEQILATISPGHPLARWARRLRQSAQRPDYRRGKYRARVRSERRRERAELAARIRQATVWWTQRQREQRDAGATRS